MFFFIHSVMSPQFFKPDVLYVDYLLVTKELHNERGYHYHCVICLCETIWWTTAKRYLQEQYQVAMNISISNELYIEAYQYVTKNVQKKFNEGMYCKTIQILDSYLKLTIELLLKIQRIVTNDKVAIQEFPLIKKKQMFTAWKRGCCINHNQEQYKKWVKIYEFLH